MGSDTRSAQPFTRGPELAHVFSGREGVSDATSLSLPAAGVERWCKQVVAEVRVPLEELVAEDRHAANDKSAVLRDVSLSLGEPI